MFGRSKARVAVLALPVASLVVGAACGNGEDRPGQVSAEDSSGSASGTGGGTRAGDDRYVPVSDVEEHAAVGDDFAAVKAKLAVAEEGGSVDWAAVEALWDAGGASKKSDGTTRTLKALVDAPDVVAMVDAAIAGGPSDEVRAQRVEKGITVLLARKVVDELNVAAEQVAEGRTTPADGAPHNVDEAWAFFTARGHGPAITADKRAADFRLEGKVREPIVVALAEAQKAAGAGDRAALAAAAEKVRTGLDYVFYLATYTYLAADDAVGRAEGAAFYLGIRPRVQAADAAADKAVTAAFESGDEGAGRAALHRDAVLAALGVEAAERVDS